MDELAQLNAAARTSQDLKTRQVCLSVARAFQCILLSQNDPAAAAQIARHRKEWVDSALLDRVLMSAIPGQTASGDSSLIPIKGIDLMSVVKPMSIVDRLPGVQRVPFDTAVDTMLSGTSSNWVGEGKPIPASKPNYSRIGTLTRLKVSTLVVETKELVKSAAVDAQLKVGSDFARACAIARDTAFMDASNSGIAGVKPPSVTFGAPAFGSTGATLAAVDSDLGRLADSLVSRGSTLKEAAWVADPLALSFLVRLRGSGGAAAFAGLTMQGGMLWGLPVIAAAAMPNVGSPQSSSIALVDGSRVWLAQDDVVEVDTSGAASVEMLDNPTNSAAPTVTATSQVSLFQTGAVALRGNQWINWKIAEPGAAAVLNNVPF